MPILDVELVLEDWETVPSDLASRLADAAGAVFGTPAGRTWVRVRRLARADYAENGGGPPTGVRPVFANVLVSRLPSPSRVREDIERLTRAIAAVCGRPIENVHVMFLPDAAGRVAFGGTLVEPR